jgi:hypothetical protein
MGRVKLHLDWCSPAAARYAVTKWHYSRRMPRFKLVRIGVWEDDRFLGAVLFGQGATPEIATPFGLDRLQVCELVRVALGEHETPVSRILAIACRMLRRQSPGIELIVSFADSAQGHVGAIYQAAGWVYVGTPTHHAYRVRGAVVHPKTLHSRYGKGGQSVAWLRRHVDPRAERITTPGKHKYVLPLTDRARQIVAPMRMTYPKCARSETSDTPADQAGKGGAAPTLALSTGGP